MKNIFNLNFILFFFSPSPKKRALSAKTDAPLAAIFRIQMYIFNDKIMAFAEESLL
jgi:hypothetical protein